MRTSRNATAVDRFNNVLLPEILTHILTFLSVSELKNLRLTSKLMYECATDSSIIKNQKFVFRSGSSVQDIVKVILNNNLQWMNIEFQGLNVNVPKNVWKSCGHRIQSLKFRNCRWSDKTIKNIILYCGQLITFKIETSYHEYFYDRRNIFCSPGLLDDLIKKRIKRMKLRTFNLFDYHFDLPDSTLYKICTIFPNVQISVGLYSSQDYFSFLNYSSYGQSVAVLPEFFKLDVCFKEPIELENLTYNMLTYDSSFQTYTLTKGNDQRLSKFETIIEYSSSKEKLLFNFFISQSNLQVVRLSLLKCYLHDLNGDHVKKLMFSVLENSPNLREFYYIIEMLHLGLSSEELSRFFAQIAKLKLLTLSYMYLNSYPCDETLPPLALTTLRLGTRMPFINQKWNEETCIMFLQQCSCLRHLELAHGIQISDDLLQKIFEYVPNLDTLILKEIRCTDLGFIGNEDGFSIKQLQRLKYLELSSNCKVALTEKFLCELNLRFLTTLNMDVKLNKPLSQTTLKYACKNLPALTSLTIGPINRLDSVKNAVQFCHNLYHLHILYFGVQKFQGKRKLMKSIFEACPSLRYVSDSESWMFSFNYLTKKVTSVHKAIDCFEFQRNIFEEDFSAA